MTSNQPASEELTLKPFAQPEGDPIWLYVTDREWAKYTFNPTASCGHHEAEYRIRTIKGGAQQLIRQCPDCGAAVGNAAKLSDAPNAPRWDYSIREQLHELQELRKHDIFETALERQAELEDQPDDQYAEYLASEAWAKKRNAVLKRDAWLCQACLENAATEVHHLTYEHIYDEPLFDLVAVCSPCHRNLHKDKVEVDES